MRNYLKRALIFGAFVALVFTYDAYANYCGSSGSFATHERGRCTAGDPSYDFYVIGSGPNQIYIPVQIEGSGYWCDLNYEGFIPTEEECWVFIYPE